MSVVVAATLVLSVTGLVYYHDSFFAATRIGDWRRMPLAYPWHIVDYGQEASGVQLEDWRVYVGEIEARKPGPVPMGAELERETLQTLKYIGRFGFKDGYLYGVRDVYCPSDSKGDVATPRWFVVRYGQDMPCYYDTEDEYKKKCKSLNIVAEDIWSFSEQWDAFHKKIFQKSIMTQVLSGLRCLAKKNVQEVTENED